MSASLFRRELKLTPLASGSRGNATYVGDGHSGVLIDCGISARQIKLRMASAGLAGAPIDAVLITHEHGDHVGGARVLAKNLALACGHAVPFYMTAGTLGALRDRVRPASAETVQPGASFQVGHLTVECYPVPHDTVDPVAWRVRSGDRWAGVITDLGRPTALVTQKLRELSLAVLEFNHDLGMLMDGPYPWSLKQRVRSSHGHLSNEQAAGLLGEATRAPLRHLVLGHLSEKNNQPHKALARAARVLAELGVGDRVSIQVAAQATPTAKVGVAVSDW